MMCFQGMQLMLSNPLDMDPRRQFALQNKGTSAPQFNTLQGFTWQPLVTLNTLQIQSISLLNCMCRLSLF